MSYGLFRVSTVGEFYKNLVISMLHAPKKPTSSHFSAIIWLNLSAILDFGVLEMSYDQINVRNGFLVFKLVKTDFLITLIAKKIRILKMPDFLMASILDYVLPPYAPGPICLPALKMLFRVHTTINHHNI